MLGAWKTRAGVSISLDNAFLFQFAEVEDCQKVLAKAPWSVTGNLLVLQSIQTEKATTKMDFR
ncbi:hypothetical protein ACSBR1_012411 [Camellia fascicularis]